MTSWQLSEENTRSLLDAASLGIIGVDARGRIVLVNPAAERMFGYTREELLGETMELLVPEGLRARHTGHRAAFHRNPHPRPMGLGMDLSARRKDGVEFPVEVSLGTWQLDSGPVYISFVTDITARKRDEQSIRLQADLLDQAHEAIFTRSGKGLIEYWNRGAEVLYGYTRAEALGKDNRELLHSHHSRGFEEIDEALAREGRWSGELTHITKDGQELVVESALVLVPRPGGDSIVLQTNRDITGRKRAEEEIRELNAHLERRVSERTAELEAANKELEAFAYSVSHDLRAPLRGIDGWSLALAEDYSHLLDERGHKYLARVRSETQRMGMLIDDLLQLSRVTRQPMQRTEVDLTNIAEGIAARIQQAQNTRSFEFVFQPGLTTPGDARLLEIALTNLFDNAAKFTGPRTAPRIEFGQMEQDGDHVFFIKDNGVGFDMTYAGTLFGAFQRLHKPSEFPGTGIGLATVNRVIRRHGGRIWAEAKINEGATFYFTIGAAK